MSYQKIRSILEATATTSLTAAGLGANQIVYDNAQETPPVAPYAVVTVSFDSATSDSLGGCQNDWINGVTQINIYTPKQTGSGRGELVATEVLKGWVDLAAKPWDGTGARVVPRSLEGPRTLAPDQRPVHVTVVAAAFSAQVT